MVNNVRNSRGYFSYAGQAHGLIQWFTVLDAQINENQVAEREK
jgi:hypothetical protein